MIFSNPAGAPELACDECGCRWFDRMANRCYECGAEVSAEAMDAYRIALAAFCDARDVHSLQSIAHGPKDQT